MNLLDRELQRQRCKKASKYLAAGSSILDLGTADGRLFEFIDANPQASLGIDIDDSLLWLGGSIKRKLGSFVEISTTLSEFDAVVMLAVAEHLDVSELQLWAETMPSLLTPSGRVVMTIPSPKVDAILHVAMKLKLLHGMEAHAHHGLKVHDVVDVFQNSGFELVTWKRFQLGLNNLLVFMSGVDGTP